MLAVPPLNGEAVAAALTPELNAFNCAVTAFGLYEGDAGLTAGFAADKIAPQPDKANTTELCVAAADVGEVDDKS